MKLDDTPARALSADPAERLVDAIDLPIGRWGRSGNEATLLFCNGPYTRWAGRSSDELVGRTLSELFGAPAWAAAGEAFAAAFDGRTVIYERRLTHQGAAAHWRVCRSSPIAMRRARSKRFTRSPSTSTRT
jgi:PAS domain-containing protein